VIEAEPHQLADDGRWTLNVNIERLEDDGIEACPYSAANTFETKEEAIQHGIHFGRQIVDGTVAGCVAP
jgi:hypothetical protein